MLLTQWEKKQRGRSCEGILCQDGEELSTDDHHGTLSGESVFSERQETSHCGFHLLHYFVRAEVTCWCW